MFLILYKDFLIIFEIWLALFPRDTRKTVKLMSRKFNEVSPYIQKTSGMSRDYLMEDYLDS